MDIKYVDIHAHLADKAFDASREKLALELGDFIVLNSGENPEENLKVLDEAKKYSNLLPCIGLHPNFVSANSKEKILEGMNYIDENISKAFAISEIGLDYRGKDEQQRATQDRIFTEILALAELKNKVCIVHSRKAIDKLLEIISSFETKVIIHNFEGNQAQYAKTAEVNAYVSISTGFVKFKRDNLIKKIDQNRLFVETDSPVLSPDEQINTPLNIPKILRYIASLRGVKELDLKESVFQNFRKLFYG